MLRFSKFFIDERDLFIPLLGIFIIIAYLLNLPIAPFKFGSLIVVFLFLILTRSLVTGPKFFSYLFLAVIGLALSAFLSPYGLLLYFLIALFLYVKTNLI